MAYTTTITPGTSLKVDRTTTPLQVECVTSLTAPGGTRPTSEWTPISVQGKKYKTGRPTWAASSGEFALDPVDPSHLRMLALYNSAPSSCITNWEVALTENGSKAIQFPGFISQFGLSFPNEGVVKAKFSIQPSGGFTVNTATAITPSATVDPCVSQGTIFKFWVTSAYAALNGVSNIEIQGGSRDTFNGTPIEASTGVVLPGYRGQTKLTFDLMYDSTEANHGAMFTSFSSLTPVTDKFQIALTKSSKLITLGDVNIDGWTWPTAPGVNIVKVSATVNVDIAIS